LNFMNYSLKMNNQKDYIIFPALVASSSDKR
jgi:hypothetical protein